MMTIAKDDGVVKENPISKEINPRGPGVIVFEDDTDLANQYRLGITAMRFDSKAGIRLKPLVPKIDPNLPSHERAEPLVMATQDLVRAHFDEIGHMILDSMEGHFAEVIKVWIEVAKKRGIHDARTTFVVNTGAPEYAKVVVVRMLEVMKEAGLPTEIGDPPRPIIALCFKAEGDELAKENPLRFFEMKTVSLELPPDPLVSLNQTE